MGLPLFWLALIFPAEAMIEEEVVNCVHVRDPLRLWPRPVIEVSSQFGDERCKLRRGALLCVAGTNGGGEPPPEGGAEGDEEAMLCYRARCEEGAAPHRLGVRDEIGANGRDVRVRRFKRSRVVCVPAEQFPALCGNGVLDDGEECDPNLAESPCPGLCLDNCACRAHCNGLAATIVGTRQDDVLFGTEGDDVIHALGGNDTVWGLGGRDVICGGAGADTLHGGSGNDLILGGRGADALIGGDDDDELRGQGGKDTLSGGAGSDTLFGGERADVLVGGEGNDRLYGQRGYDTLDGGAGEDILEGGAGDDRLFGGEGDDVCAGGSGIDVCASCSTADNTCEDLVP